jgi:hypothetical protein
MARITALWRAIAALVLLLFVTPTTAVSGAVEARSSYKLGDAVPVTCLARNMSAPFRPKIKDKPSSRKY